MDVFEEVASAHHCLIVPIDMPALGSVEHFLFAVRMEELTERDFYSQVGDAHSIAD
jgi:hypothetical protein